MPHLRVVSPGFQTTVQDLGRFGRAHHGISASGAADTVAMRLGNLLVGNPEDAAVLEMTLVGGTFEFESPTWAAVAGSDFQPALDGAAVPCWSSFRVRAGGQIVLGATRTGARCCLCVEGGVREPPVQGSVSTHLMTGLGGHQGRALRAGDRLEYGGPSGIGGAHRRVRPEVLRELARDAIRVTRGPQAALFPADALEAFASSAYLVTEESNRMGIRLRGLPLVPLEKRDMVTEGVSLGAIQAPPDGQPIILFVEHQTTGGYPKPANVISADTHTVGQLRPRDSVRFQFVSFEEAREIFRRREALIGASSLMPL